MRKELTYVHLAVLLFGLSGLFAKWISLPSHVIVIGRVFFAAIFLYIILIILKKKILLPSLRAYLPFIVIGAVLALHWGSFFHSIQLSSVAIGLVTFATFPIFASFLEPLVFKEPFQKELLVLAIITFLGVLFIVPNFDVSTTSTQGALWGLLSAITFAILSILNRKFVEQHSSLVIGFYQNFFAFLWLIPLFILVPSQITSQEISLLLLLGILFTGVAHVVFIQGLSKVNVRSASIIATLEPVYGIFAAAILLQEIPVLREGIGIALILFPAIYVSWRKF